MTAHAHESPASDDGARLQPDLAGPASSRRPWWLGPVIAIGMVVAALVIAGVLSLSTVLYIGFFGGMLFMHAGGHGGHGGHGGQSGAAGGHRH